MEAHGIYFTEEMGGDDPYDPYNPYKTVKSYRLVNTNDQPFKLVISLAEDFAPANFICEKLNGGLVYPLEVASYSDRIEFQFGTYQPEVSAKVKWSDETRIFRDVGRPDQHSMVGANDPSVGFDITFIDNVTSMERNDINEFIVDNVVYQYQPGGNYPLPNPSDFVDNLTTHDWRPIVIVRGKQAKLLIDPIPDFPDLLNIEAYVPLANFTLRCNGVDYPINYTTSDDFIGYQGTVDVDVNTATDPSMWWEFSITFPEELRDQTIIERAKFPETGFNREIDSSMTQVFTFYVNEATGLPSINELAISGKHNRPLPYALIKLNFVK